MTGEVDGCEGGGVGTERGGGAAGPGRPSDGDDLKTEISMESGAGRVTCQQEEEVWKMRRSPCGDSHTPRPPTVLSVRPRMVPV